MRVCPSERALFWRMKVGGPFSHGTGEVCHWYQWTENQPLCLSTQAVKSWGTGALPFSSELRLASGGARPPFSSLPRHTDKSDISAWMSEGLSIRKGRRTQRAAGKPNRLLGAARGWKQMMHSTCCERLCEGEIYNLKKYRVYKWRKSAWEASRVVQVL